MRAASWSLRLASSLTDRLLVLLVVAAAAGALLPGPAGTLRTGTPVILAAMIAGLGLGVGPADLVRAFRRPRLLGLALAAQVASTPLVGWALWTAAGPDPVLAGLVVQATAPTEITAPLMVGLAGGRVAVALPVMATSLLLAPAVMPALLSLILGRSIPVPAGAMLGSLALTVVLPLLAGTAVHARSRHPRVLRRLGRGLSAAMVVLLVLAVAGGAVGSPAAAPGRLAALAAGALILLAAGLGVGRIAAQVPGGDPGDSRVLTFTTGMREFGVATAVSLSFFGPEAAVGPAVYGVIMMVVTAWLARVLTVGGSGAGR